MLPEAERRALRERHVHGEDQIRALFAQVKEFATNHRDVNFTPSLLSTITAETLIVFGDRDFLYPVGIAFELNAAIARSFLWVVPNGGHGPIFAPAEGTTVVADPAPEDPWPTFIAPSWPSLSMAP